MFNVDNLHLVVSGVDENTLQEVAQQWAPLSGKKSSPPPSKYKGGKRRVDVHTNTRVESHVHCIVSRVVKYHLFLK